MGGIALTEQEHTNDSASKYDTADNVGVLVISELIIIDSVQN